MIKSWISLALLVVAVPSHAVVYAGNPDLSFTVDRPVGDLTYGDVTLTKFRIHPCSGSDVDYPVDEDIDPVDGFTYIDVTGGNLCGVTFYWGTDMILNGNDGTSFVLEYTANTTSVTFATPIPAVLLTGTTILSGSPTGTGPKIYVTMN